MDLGKVTLSLIIGNDVITLHGAIDNLKEILLSRAKLSDYVKRNNLPRVIDEETYLQVIMASPEALTKAQDRAIRFAEDTRNIKTFEDLKEFLKREIKTAKDVLALGLMAASTLLAFTESVKEDPEDPVNTVNKAIFEWITQQLRKPRDYFALTREVTKIIAINLLKT